MVATRTGLLLPEKRAGREWEVLGPRTVLGSLVLGRPKMVVLRVATRTGLLLLADLARQSRVRVAR